MQQKAAEHNEIKNKHSIWEFYHLFDKHMEQVIKKTNALYDDAPFLTIEELAVELYSCFMRTSTLVDLLTEYDDFNKYYFLNGREAKDEEYYKQLCSLKGKRLDAMSYWKEHNYRFDSKFGVDDSAFPRGYKLAKRNENSECQRDIEQYKTLDKEGKVKRNIECLEATTSLGVPMDLLKKAGIDTSDLSKMELAKQFAEVTTLDKPEVRDVLSQTHVNILKSFLIYDNLFEHILKHLCDCMSRQGWKRLEILDDTELLKRFDEMEQIIELTPQYKEYRDNIFAESLLDEGEPTKEKIKEFKKNFIAKYRSEDIIKVYILKKNNLVEMIREIISRKFDSKQLETLLYYKIILKEIDKFGSNTLTEHTMNLPQTTIQAINIIMGNPVIAGDANIDKNFGAITTKE